MKVLVVGNCQAAILADLFRGMIVDVQVAQAQLMPAHLPRLHADNFTLADLDTGGSDISTLVDVSDLIFLQNVHDLSRLLERDFPQSLGKVRLFPGVLFTGFHPDMISLSSVSHSPTGTLHSSIACYGWTNSLTVRETIDLFREEVFAELGFFDYWGASVKFLSEAGRAVALPLDQYIDRWAAQGVWMHTMNHPKIHVLADVARAILMREGISFRPDVEHHMIDPLARHAAWSVYPEIARRLGVKGGYEFTESRRLAAGALPPHKYDLEGFVRASFENYTGHDKQHFACARLASPRYQVLSKFLKKRASRPAEHILPAAVKSEASSAVGGNPYQGLADYQFWRRAIERLPMGEVDPVVRPRFTLNRDDKVATAGSCFAQHISRTLVKHGFNYYIAEHAEHIPKEEAQRRNYGVFSARYGNLYTTRQLLQLFDRAYGRFTPVEDVWMRGDGRLVDPFRPQIEPEGFATVEELERSRAEHFKAVRGMFEKLDVFVFTFGLTEAWRSRIDGAVYPLAPGVMAGEYNADKHEFVNFDAAEVTADMQAFVHRLLRVNPHARMILTVSPVPLIATYEDRHVLVSMTYSKSVLRVAAEEICQRNPMCAYFPSYEIITGNYTRSEYYESDLRSVKQQGVDHVMRLFLAHYSSENGGSSLDQELMLENAAVAEVVCDEEVIDD